MVASALIERAFSVIERDLRFLTLPQPNLGSRLRILQMKYWLHVTHRVGLTARSQFRLFGRPYHVTSHTDGALLERVLLDTHTALQALGLLGAKHIHAVDVGAHNGETALAWSLFLDGPSIMSFEPDDVPYQNAMRNTIGRPVALSRLGLGNRTGTEQLDTSHGHGGAASYLDAASSPHKIQTKIVRGDEILADQPIDLIKIDVEGYERHVLEGMRGALERCRYLVIEVSLQRSKDHSFFELASLFADAKCELVGTSRPHMTADGKQTAVDLCFRRSASPAAAAR